MKKIFILLYALLLSPLSCYLVTTENGISRVKLALITPFPPGVTALHVAVYQGAAVDENLIFYQVYFPGSAVVTNIPSGPDRIFALWAEGTTGTATYYGTAGPLNLGGGANQILPISMVRFNVSANVFNFIYTNPTYTWNPAVGAAAYELKEVNTFYTLQTIYFGPATRFNSSGPIFGKSTIRAYSSVFNLFSDSVTSP